MAIDVTADPIEVTAAILGTDEFWIAEAAPIEVSTSLYAVRSQYPYAQINPALDLFFDCQDDVDNPDVIEVLATLNGSWFNVSVIAEAIEVTTTLHGSLADGLLITAEPFVVTLSFKDADILLEATKKNWVKWSDIGSLDFTIGRGNVAGERPLDWSGWVYEVLQLNDKVIAYGENGVSILKPADKYYGLDTISRLGLYSPGAVVGTAKVHYFIDSKGQLWELGDTLTLLNYSEFFSLMDNLIISYDVENNLIYICDGTLGYVYSPLDKSLGAGPVNVTGIGSKDSNLYITSPATIETKTFEICTDIYDMGTRKFKTVKSIEVGTDLTENMEASIDYRVSNKVAFANIGWHPVTLEGVSHLTCYGLEFRFKLRVQTYEYFELDYLKINGFVHNYSYTEHTLRSISEQREN